MTKEEEIELYYEIRKCRENPYYFATKYATLNGEPFTTTLSEEEFNNHYKSLPENSPHFKKEKI
jgi:hypothetical protein